MKKLIALIAVAVTAVAVAAADPLIVVHGFVNLNALGTSFKQEEISDVSSFGAFGKNVSVGGGVGVNIPFGGYFGVQPGIDIYANRLGYKFEGSDSTYAYSYVSMDIPVLFTAKVEKWNFQLGPYLSIPLGKLKGVGTFGSYSIESESDITSNVLVGMLFGVGYEERLGLGRIVFGANYMLDFMPIEYEVLGGTEKGFTRRGLIIDIGYKVPLTFFGG